MKLPFFQKQIKPLEPMNTSPGKIKLYQQCSLKYNYQHVTKRQGEALPRTHLSFYSTTQKAIERYQVMLLRGDCDVERDSLMKLLESNWVPTDYPKPEDRDDFYQALHSTGESMTAWFSANRNFILTYQGKPAIGMFASAVMGPLTIWTRLDRVERMPNGDIRLISFKSGSRQSSEENLKADLGVRLNIAAARELFGSNLTRYAVVYLRSGNSIEIDTREMGLDRIQEDVFEVARSIQNKDFKGNPGPLCSTCEYLTGCESWSKPPWEYAGETREVYAQRLRLSYSKMSLFERCPRAYSQLYNEGVPPKPQPFFSFGSCLHAVMEDYYDTNTKPRRTLEFLYELLEKKWREFQIGYKDANEETLYKEKAKKMLRQYYDRFVAGKKFKPAAEIETYFELPVGPDSIMTGFIDRIDRHPHGGYIILDYKTEPTDRTQEAVDKDLQLTLYYWAAQEFLGLEITELGLFMMSFDKLTTTVRGKENIPVLLDRIIQVTSEIRNEKDFAPKINKYCLSCDHLAGCPLEDEIRARPDLRSMAFSESD